MHDTDILNAIGGLLVGAIASVVFVFIGAVMWEAGTQKVAWSMRVAALGIWSWAGSCIVTAIDLSLAPFRWWSLAQENSLGHLVLACWVFSWVVIMVGALIYNLSGKRL